MIEPEKLTKAELIEAYKDLQGEYEDLSQQLEDAEEWGGEQENSAYEYMDKLEELEGELEELKENAILDIEDFKRKLNIQNLMNKELEEFIENYLRFENKVS